MRFRLLAFAVLLYLSLDFSNPLIPGAVSFISGEVEMVEGAQSRGPETPAAAMAATPRADAVRPLDRHAPHVPVVGASVRTEAVSAPPRRPLSPPGDSAPSPDDD
jgi:hypothetical protein